MIKKYLIIFFLLSLLYPLISWRVQDGQLDIVQKMYPNDNVQAINRPHSSLIIDGNTGNVLWKDNIDEVRDPASMSELMTLYLLFEDMANGKISKDTVIKATADQAIGKIYGSPTIILLLGGYPIPVDCMTVVPSSNVSTLMLANLMSNNDPDAFIERMNAKAKELGMTIRSGITRVGRPSPPCRATIRSTIIQMMRPTRQLRVI